VNSRIGRLLVVGLVTLMLSALCVRLGLWQWHRMEDKNASAAAMERQLTQRPVPLPGSPKEWTRVIVRGQFLADKQVTVKFMVRNSAPGVDVVTPLLMTDGRTVLIDRGWMPSGNDDERPTDIPDPPTGVVTVEGWWRPDSGAPRHAIKPASGQVRAISSHGLREHVGRPLVQGYVNQQQPANGLAPEPKPALRSALNFFYALQWWFFAALVLFGVPVLGQAKATRSA
jgi:cytochrome oxidase assembly protein ShyY1